MIPRPANSQIGVFSCKEGDNKATWEWLYLYAVTCSVIKIVERKVPAFSLRDSLPVECARTSDQYLATTGPGLHRRFRPTLKTLSYALMLTGIGKAPAVVTSVVDWVPKL
jgi:hypothetical protein